MVVYPTFTPETATVDPEGVGHLIRLLLEGGYEVIGPRLGESAVVYDTLNSADDLPWGWTDEQDGGVYRLVKSDREALFDYVVGPHSLKQYLFPPTQRLWRAQRRETDFFVEAETGKPPKYAFIGVRSCEIHAMQIQDRVFDNGTFTDPGYLARRANAFIVAVNCGRPGGTCFCTSMGAGPKVVKGFDLVLTELIDTGRHHFLIETGSEKGAAVLAKLPHESATRAAQDAAEAVLVEAAKAMGRQMVPNVAVLLKENLEHTRWDEIAERCLTCANCTMVCPTCFCTTVEETTDLSGKRAERWRKWDSCFNIEFSYIHGGSVRSTGRSRYRQWMTHKLSYWYDQFGSSGCVGCGRCITWCPVGIDITEEARAIMDNLNPA